jgi:hypothetical protein
MTCVLQHTVVVCWGTVGGQDWSGRTSSRARHGDEDEGDLLAPVGGRLDQGRMCASLWRILTAPIPSPFFMVER